MTAALVLQDGDDVADLDTFVSRARARAMDAAGAIRLTAFASTVAATVAVQPGAGLLGAGAVLGLRAWRLAVPVEPGKELDVVVELAAVADRVARLRGLPAGPAARELAVPPVAVAAPWAGVAPPRSGWARVASVPVELLTQAAGRAVDDVAATVPGAPEGVSYALARGARALGFLTGSTALFATHGRWRRLSTAAGVVLAR